MCRSFGVELGVKAWIAIVLPLVIVCSWIRNLDTLTSFSMIANLCIVFSLGVCHSIPLYCLQPGGLSQYTSVLSSAWGSVTVYLCIAFSLGSIQH